MKVYRRNHGDFKTNPQCWDLVKSIVESIEDESGGSVPNSSEVVSKLREVGWDSKIRLVEGFQHSIDGILEGVGIVVGFGHSGASFQKLLTMQSMYYDGRIDECYYISQTRETSVLRHKLVNPNAKDGTNGNRISVEDLDLGMDYYHRFITIPLTLIGIEIGKVGST